MSYEVSPSSSAPLTTLNPAASYTTIIDTLIVEPEQAEALVDLLVRLSADTLRHVPGFVSADFPINLDRTQVVNYAQWKTARRSRLPEPIPSCSLRHAEAFSNDLSEVPECDLLFIHPMIWST